MQARPILLVDDYPLQLSFTKLVKQRTTRDVLHAKTFEHAIAVLQQPMQFCGLILDVELSKESGAPTGFDVLAVARRQEPRIPAGMLTGHLDVELVARAAELGAFYVPKSSNVMEALEHFFLAALAYGDDGTLNTAVDRVLARLPVERGSVTADVLRLQVHGLPPEDVRARLDISLNTYKTHCRRLCHAGQCGHVLDLVREVWRQHSNTKAPTE